MLEYVAYIINKRFILDRFVLLHDYTIIDHRLTHMMILTNNISESLTHEEQFLDYFVSTAEATQYVFTLMSSP